MERDNGRGRQANLIFWRAETRLRRSVCCWQLEEEGTRSVHGSPLSPAYPVDASLCCYHGGPVCLSCRSPSSSSSLSSSRS